MEKPLELLVVKGIVVDSWRDYTAYRVIVEDFIMLMRQYALTDDDICAIITEEQKLVDELEA